MLTFVSMTTWRIPVSQWLVRLVLYVMVGHDPTNSGKRGTDNDAVIIRSFQAQQVVGSSQIMTMIQEYHPNPYRSKIQIFCNLLNPARSDRSRQPPFSTCVKIAA